MSERLIFITNDDGYKAKGIKAIVEVAREFGRVVVVAPDSNRTGMSHAITVYDPLYLKLERESDGVQIYSFSGTPVDCVKMALDHLLLEERVDMVISGINHGSNAGVNVLYSGTMGAAIEGSFYNCPSIGFSLDDHSLDADFEAAKGFCREIIEGVFASKASMPMCLNVNIPALPADEIKGVRVVRQNRGYWREEFHHNKDPRGRSYFWLTGAFINTEPDADDADVALLEAGYVSVVPIQVDMTDYEQLQNLKGLDRG